MEQMRIALLYFLLLVIISPASSQEADKYILFEHEGYEFPYSLKEPNKLWKLPKRLVEVSGLSYIKDHKIACIQDEKANIYLFNLKTEEVEDKISFGDEGDYEGVEIVGKNAWVLKSNGTLYHVKNYLKEDKLKVKKHTTELTGKNDLEGLAYNPLNNKLYLACKGHPYLHDEKGKDFKAIYQYNLDTKKLDINPFLLINIDSIRFYKEYNTMAHLGMDLLAYFDDVKGDLSLQPSGISIHPQTGNIYILASVGNLLVVYSPEGKLLSVIKLRAKYFAQPEGICFSPNGTLFISNEGDNDNATLMKFNTKKKKK